MIDFALYIIYIQIYKSQVSVVIAIIAILAGMLLPALSQARDRAKTTACQNKLRNIAFGALRYAEDNKGYFPCSLGGNCMYNYVYNTFSDNLTNKNNVGGLAGYLGIDRKYGTWSFNPLAPPEVWCPSGGRQNRPNELNRSGNPNFSYGFSTWYVSGGATTDGMRVYSSESTQPLLSNLKKARKAAGRMLCGDIGYDGIYSMYPTDPLKSRCGAAGLYNRLYNFSYRHGKQTNVGFLDGHVKSMSYGQIPLNANYGRTYDPNEFYREYP